MRLLLACFALLVLIACDETELPCVEGQDPACAPLYPPTFDNVFKQTLAATCAQAGSSCHASGGAKGGLVFEEIERSYELLLGTPGGEPRVIPGDISCSVLMRRIEHPSETLQMPPGKPLSDAERCAIQQWIANGAPR